MSTTEIPYIAQCAICGDGLLRFYRCDSCHEVVAMCDECESIWNSIAAVFDDQQIPADGAFPDCSVCLSIPPSWTRADFPELEAVDLDQFIAGLSD